MTDHYSDGYDLIEIEAPEGTPIPNWLTSDWMPCLDCRANTFLKWLSDGVWSLTIAHDETCPELKRIVSQR